MVKIVILRDSHLFAPALNAALVSLPIDHRALAVDWFFFGLILDPRCEASYTTSPTPGMNQLFWDYD